MTGYTRIIASKIQDINGKLVSGGTALFQLVGAQPGEKGAARLGGGGVLVDREIGFNVENGQLLNPADHTAPCYLPDVSKTNPQYVGFKLRIAVKGRVVLDEGYGFLQPTGDVWSLDDYTPNVTSQQVTVGPAPSLSIGAVASVPEGTPASASFTPAGLGAYALNLNIPRAPASYKSSKVAYTSLLGCLGGDANQAHDDALVNAFLATATADSPALLVVDQWLTTRTIIIPDTGNVSIVGMGDGTGWKLADNTNPQKWDGMLRCGFNGHHTEDGSTSTVVLPPARIAQNIYLANFRLDGNRANNLATYTMGIAINECVGVTIDNVTVNHSRAYAIAISNCSMVTVRNCKVMPFLISETPEFFTNTDGIHFYGPVENIVIQGCTFRCGDDAIALNASEGYGGDISDVVISDCIFTPGSVSGMRINPNYAAFGFKIRKVLIRNITADIADDKVGILLGGSVSGNASDNAIEDVTIDGFVYSGKCYGVIVAESCGSIKLSNVTWKIPRNCPLNGLVVAWSSSLTINELILKDVTYQYLDDNVGGANIVDFANGAFGQGYGVPCTVKRLVIDGFTEYRLDNVDYTGGKWLMNLNTNPASTFGEIYLANITSKRPYLTQAFTSQFPCNNVTGPALINLYYAAGDTSGIARSCLIDSVVGNGSPYYTRTKATADDDPDGVFVIKRKGSVFRLETTELP